MYKAVEPIKQLIKVKRFTTSDAYFMINTKLTPIMLLFFSVLLSALELLRASIDCYTDNTTPRKAMMDNYCWSIGTYICKDNKSGKIVRYQISNTVIIDSLKAMCFVLID